MKAETGTKGTDLRFSHDFGDIAVSMTGPMNNASIQVRGPAEFVKNIDWDSVYSTARLFGAHTNTCMAFALAVQQKFAAWHGTQVTLAAFRKERCTVHASPDCLDPDGPTYSGQGWDHDGQDQRIECSACASALGS